jgi:uncharacterized protein (DUF58 family)
VIQPTWRLAVLAALAGVVVVALPGAAWQAWLLLNGVLVAATVVDGLRAPSPQRLEVERDLPAVVALDGTATISWRVRAPDARRVLRVRLSDELAPSLRAEGRRATVTVPVGGRGVASSTLNPSRRGRFTLRDVAARVEGPWGLAARQATLTVPGELRVYPLFRSRGEAELRLNRSRILEVGLRSAQGRGGGTEFDALREYTVDDEFRRIDWAATARADKPIVRTYRAERNQNVLVLLDTGRIMAGRVRDPDAGGAEWGDVPRLDHAMDAVMLLTTLATRLGDRAGMVAFSDRVRAAVPPGHARDQLARVTDAMFDLQPELVESDYRGAFAATLGRFHRRGLFVVVTELAAEAVAETLLPALPLVTRSHLVIVAGIRDPSVDRWARAVPTEAGAAYRKAAAVADLTERRRTVARLRATGAVVIDETPAHLAAHLADAYLRVKATGRL